VVVAEQSQNGWSAFFRLYYWMEEERRDKKSLESEPGDEKPNRKNAEKKCLGKIMSEKETIE